MQKWNLPAVAAVLAAFAAPAQAAGAAGKADGCVLLAELVYGHVRSVNFAGAGPGGGAAAAARRGVLHCDRTAEAVSEGFTRALAESQVFVTWPSLSDIPGDRCLSADLSQCYPRSNPYLSPYGSATASWVAARWKSVQAAVVRNMPAGAATDETRFAAAALDTQLRRRLGVRTPRQRY